MVSSAAYCSHSVTFWRNHINNKRGIFCKRSCLNLSVGAWERILCWKNHRGISQQDLSKIVVEDRHRRHHRKEAWQRVEPGSGQLLTKRSSSGIHVFKLAFEHTEDILNIAFRHVWYLHRRTPLWQPRVCTIAYGGRLMFWCDLTKPAATVAAIDRFYWNSMIHLQLDVNLLMQNFVKIRLCLPEIWKHVQGFTFFPDTV